MNSSTSSSSYLAEQVGKAALGIVVFVAMFFMVYTCSKPSPHQKTEEEIALDAQELKWGTRPRMIGQVVVPIDAYLRTNLKDPDSLDYIAWWAPSGTNWKGKDGWVAGVQFRARNSFGGMEIEKKVFFLQGDTIVDIETDPPTQIAAH